MQELRWACEQAWREEEAFLADLAFRLRDVREEVEAGSDTLLYAVFDGDAVKLGIASDPLKRAASLQIANPRPLILLAAAPATKALERFVHDLLSEWRIQGEWFRASGPVLAFSEMLYSAAEQCVMMEESGDGPCDVRDTVSIMALDIFDVELAA